MRRTVPPWGTGNIRRTDTPCTRLATRVVHSRVDPLRVYLDRDQIKIAPQPLLPALNCAGISAVPA